MNISCRDRRPVPTMAPAASWMPSPAVLLGLPLSQHLLSAYCAPGPEPGRVGEPSARAAALWRERGHRASLRGTRQGGRCEQGGWGWGNSARGVLEKGPGGEGGHPREAFHGTGVTGALQDTGLRGRPGGPAASCRPGFCQDGCQVAMPGQRLLPEPLRLETKPEMCVLCENS